MQTILGRRRYIPEVEASNIMIRQAGERMAVNMPIQGSAADIMKLAMIKIHRRLYESKLKSKLLLQVHDELIFEVPSNELIGTLPTELGCLTEFHEFYWWWEFV